MDLTGAHVVAVALALTAVTALPAPDPPAEPRTATGERGVGMLLTLDPPMATAVATAAPPQRAPAAAEVVPPPSPAPVQPRVRVVPRGLRPARPAPLPAWQQRRGEAALDLIAYDWRRLGWTISFHPAQRGVLGIASQHERRIRMYVRREHSARLLAFSIAHEVGHALDFSSGTAESRARWLELRGIAPGTEWFGCEGCADLDTPAGDFAEVFAAWQVGFVDFRSRIAPRPSPEQMRLLEQHIAELTARVSG